MAKKESGLCRSQFLCRSCCPVLFALPFLSRSAGASHAKHFHKSLLWPRRAQLTLHRIPCRLLRPLISWMLTRASAGGADRTFFTMVAYLGIIGDMIGPAVGQWMGGTNEDFCSVWADRRVFITCALGVVFPLSLIRNIDSLKFTSLFALLAITYLTIIVRPAGLLRNLLHRCLPGSPKVHLGCIRGRPVWGMIGVMAGGNSIWRVTQGRVYCG